jgi:hypothetical protein
MVTRTRLSVTLYVHCLSCLFEMFVLHFLVSKQHSSICWTFSSPKHNRHLRRRIRNVGGQDDGTTNTRSFCRRTRNTAVSQSAAQEFSSKHKTQPSDLTAHVVPQPNDVTNSRRRYVCNVGPSNYLFITLLLSRDQAIGGCSHFFLPCTNTPRRDTVTNDHILVYSIRHSEMDGQWKETRRHAGPCFSTQGHPDSTNADRVQNVFFFDSYITHLCSRLFTKETNTFSQN